MGTHCFFGGEGRTLKTLIRFLLLMHTKISQNLHLGGGGEGDLNIFQIGSFFCSHLRNSVKNAIFLTVFPHLVNFLFPPSGSATDKRLYYSYNKKQINQFFKIFIFRASNSHFSSKWNLTFSGFLLWSCLQHFSHLFNENINWSDLFITSTWRRVPVLSFKHL